MSAASRYIKSLGRLQWVIENQSKDLDHADSMLQPPFQGNCLNWNLGHIMVYREQNLGRLDGESAYDPEEFAIYGAGSPALTDPDLAVPLDELLERLATLKDKFVAALENVSEAQLAEILNPERGTTLDDYLDFQMFHEALHLGELTLLRQLAGKDDQVI